MSRKWENDDTKWFFEALCEHGKDFHSIQTFIAARSEKKKGATKNSAANVDSIKSREQVRHYYYRTWHKIASCLEFNEDIFQQTKELYGLINYGEIWKKFGSKFDSKIKTYLKELVFNGQTIAKVKGKNVKLKTPLCKALKKIHKLEDSKVSSTAVDVSNLPKEVYVELHPANNASWLRVHSLSQNPRVRTKLPLQKRLSSFIAYLQRRWSETRVRAAECESFTVELPQTSENVSRNNLVFTLRPHPQVINDLKGVTIKRIPINSNAQIDLSLSAFIEKMYKNNEIEKKSKKHVPPNTKSKNSEEPMAIEGEIKMQQNEELKNSKINDEDSKSSEPPIAETVRSLSLLKDMLASVDDLPQQRVEEAKERVKNESEPNLVSNNISINSDHNVNTLPLPPANSTIGEWLQASVTESNETAENTVEAKSPAPQNTEQQSTSIDNQQQSTLDIETIKKGWTLRDADLTIGELYLMLERPEKIMLEYDWVSKEAIAEPKEEIVRQGHQNTESPSETVLSKLLIAASLALMNLKKQDNHQQTNLLLSPTKSSKVGTRKNKRIKPNSPPETSNADAASSSHLLTSLINTTILNDNNVDNKVLVESSDNTENHQPFLIPTSPAPKSATKTNKSRTVCGDPTLLQEAIRQLNSNRFQTRKHPRKSRPKPTFVQKPLLPRCPGVVNNITSLPSLPAPILNHVLTQSNLSSVVNTSIGNTTIREQIQIPYVMPSAQHIVVNSANVTVPVNVNVGQMLSASTNSALISAMIGSPLISTAPTQVSASSSTEINGVTSKIEHEIQPTTATKSSSISTPSSLSSLIATSSVITSSSPSSSSNTFSSVSQCDRLHIVSSPSLTTSSSPSLSVPNSVNTITDTAKSSLSSCPPISCLLDMSLGEPPPLFGENSCSSLSDAIGFNKINSNEESITINDKRPFNNLSMESTDPLPSQSAPMDPLVSALNTACKSENSENSLLTPLKVTPPLPENWLNGDSSDISFGSLFNTSKTNESTSQKTLSTSFITQDDMDTQLSLSNLVTDNSVDLVAKFADLTESINEADSNKSKTT